MGLFSQPKQLTLNDLVELSQVPYSIQRVGSRVTCDPVRAGADYDYLIHVDSRLRAEFLNDLRAGGFRVEQGTNYVGRPVELGVGGFASYRRGVDNLIITTDSEFYKKFLVATRIAAQLNIQEKKNRIMLFQYILYGNMEHIDLIHKKGG